MKTAKLMEDYFLSHSSHSSITRVLLWSEQRYNETHMNKNLFLQYSCTIDKATVIYSAEYFAVLFDFFPEPSNTTQPGGEQKCKSDL